jgi:hypothetical protein
MFKYCSDRRLSVAQIQGRVSLMSTIDRQRIAAVRVLAGLGYLFDGSTWKPPVDQMIMSEADAMYTLLMEQADALMGCPEGSAEDDALNGIIAVLQAYETKRWPEGKEPGGKGS